MAKEAGMVCGTDGAWCEFCQRFHSSETCFHPGKQPMTEYERQYPLLKEENEKLKAQIADRKAVLKACSNRNEIIERRIAELKEKYHELLYAVHRKFPDESRHETALRYIHEAETSNNEAASCSKVEVSDE